MEALASPPPRRRRLLALQAAANVQLSAATGSVRRRDAARHRRHPAAGGHGRRRAGAFGLLDEAPGWHLVGGLASASTSPPASCCSRARALLTVGLWITGQMLASLALDGFGWLGVAARPGVAQVGAAAVIVAAR